MKNLHNSVSWNYQNYPQESINADEVKICKLVDGALVGCQAPRAANNDQYLLRSGMVTADFGGVYV